MTTILFDEKDSIGVPLVGYVIISLDATVETDTTGYHTAPGKVDLVNGQATVELTPSELSRVTYRFQLFQTIDSTNVLIKDIRAKVPDLADPIPFVDLSPTLATNDAMDASILAVSRRMIGDNQFWARFQDSLLQVKGVYDPGAWYQRGNMVFYQGGSYVYINRLASTAIAPVAGQTTAYWQPMALPGQTVVGALDPAVLGLKADKTYVDDQLATKVSANGAILTDATTAGDPVLTARNNRLVSSNWVQSLADEIRKRLHNVGDIGFTAGTSAPQFWVPADGRTLSRTTYADLFAICQTRFNTGGEAGTVFRVPDLRGRMPLGVDRVDSVQGNAGRVASATTVGNNGGSASMSLTVGQMPSHNHVSNTGVFQSLGAGGFNVQVAAGTAHGSPVLTTSSTGNGDPIDKMNPYLSLLPIIYTGV